jgi:hypothetical protein
MFCLLWRAGPKNLIYTVIRIASISAMGINTGKYSQFINYVGLDNISPHLLGMSLVCQSCTNSHQAAPLHSVSRRLVHCKKGNVFPVPSRDVTFQTLPGRELLNYFRPGREFGL